MHLPYNTAIMLIGTIPPNETMVSFHEIKHRRIMVAMMKIKHLMNIEMLVLKPSYITLVSELILLKISPVLVSSKNVTSL